MPAGERRARRRDRGAGRRADRRSTARSLTADGARGGRVAADRRVRSRCGRRPGDEVLSGSFVVGRRRSGTGRRPSARDAYAVRLAEEARRFTLVAVGAPRRDRPDPRYVTWAIVPTAALLFWSQLRAHDALARGAVGRRRRHGRDGPRGARAADVDRVRGRGRPPRPRPRPGPGAAGGRGARPRRRAVRRQDRDAHRGHARGRRGRAARRASTRARARGARGARPRAERDDARDRRRPTPTRTGLASAGPGAVRVLAGVERARRSTSTARGSWARPTRCSPPGDGPRRRWRSAPRAGSGSSCSRRAPSLDGDRLPADLEPVAAVVLADRVRPDAAATLRYFAEQGVTVKVLSGDHPAAVGAIARRLGLDGRRRAGRRRDLDDDDLGAAARGRHSVFGRVTPAPQAGDGPRAPGRRPHRRDDRRRRERRRSR